MGGIKVEEQVYCIGCGVPIQTEDKKALGYAPKSALERDIVICQRCFRLKHYNEIQDVSLTDEDFLKMFSLIFEDQKALIVKIVDIFDFNGSWLPNFKQFANNHRVILVGNKVDLLPKSVNHKRLRLWLKERAKEMGIDVLDVFLMSAHTKAGVKEVAAAIDQFRQKENVYIVGCTNVGKSTFINRLIQEFGGDTEQLITTSYFPGTTLSFIDLPLDDGKTLFDTPGIINEHQMAHYVDEVDLKVITPKKEIKSRVFQLNAEQTLFFGGLARLDFIAGERTSFVCYVSNELKIHRTKLANADSLYEKHVGERLTPPNQESKKTFPSLKRVEFQIDGEKDIVFSGLGWVTVHAKQIQIAAYVPEGVQVFVRKAII